MSISMYPLSYVSVDSMQLRYIWRAQSLIFTFSLLVIVITVGLKIVFRVMHNVYRVYNVFMDTIFYFNVT